MKIAVLSDTHGRNGTLALALGMARERGATLTIHCGDIEDPDTFSLFHGLDAHFVWGNCDTDRDELQAAAAGAGVTLHGDWGQLERDGVQLAFTHGDDRSLLRDLEQSGHFDFVFHGHTHQAAERRVGTTCVLNPGALHRARPKTFVVIDLPSREVESVVVE